MRKSTKLVIYNIAFIIISFLCFSKWGLGLGFDTSNGPVKFAVSAILVLFGICMLFLGNCIILIFSDKSGSKIGKLETIDDCIGALHRCIKTDPAFNAEIIKAIEQLKILQRRRESLRELLQQNDASESFKYLNNTADKAEFYALSNVRSIINQLLVFDNEEYASNPDSVNISTHKEFITSKLESNKIILKEYSEFLLAVSAIGDTQNVNIDEIRDMTEALNRVLKRDEFKELERKYQDTQG